MWQRQGYDVEFLFGTDRFVPADLCIVHLDLTILPHEYTDFIRQYPLVINGEVVDIRKSSISEILLRPADSYTGRVIVKTDYNYAGWPEKRLMHSLPYLAWCRIKNRLLNSPYYIINSFDYRIYDQLEEVPTAYFEDSAFVVEKFLPEKEGNFYVSRACLFMGGVFRCYRRGSRNPIVKYRGIEFEQVYRAPPRCIPNTKKDESRNWKNRLQYP